MRSRAGLFVIDLWEKKTIILKRTLPYKDSECFAADGFVEEYCIPRGEVKHNHETDIECGIREFIEECGVFFSKFVIIPEFFNLEWCDPPQKNWRYVIRVLLVSMEDIFEIAPLNIVGVSRAICDMVRDVYRQKRCRDQGAVQIRLLPQIFREIPLVTPASVFVELPAELVAKSLVTVYNCDRLRRMIKNKLWESTSELVLLKNRDRGSRSAAQPKSDDIKKLRAIQFEYVSNRSMRLKEYETLVRRRLKFYHSSNYNKFFNFLKNILVRYSKDVAN